MTSTRKQSIPTRKPKTSPGLAPQTFRAALEPDHTSLKWVIARLPFDPHSAWTEMLRLRVRGEINGVPFRSSLFPLAGGVPGHIILVNKRMQAVAGVWVGEMANFRLEPDLEIRSAELPPELVTAFAGDRDLHRWARSLNESTRREIGKWIAGASSPQSGARRSVQMAERLLLTMEGERDAPPILEAAFRRHPLARAGWNAMTPNQRRSHLFGIFYYQSPAARERRTGRAIEAALRAKTGR